MPDGLYDRDALAWAEHQAGLLRRLAAGERLNETIDWSHVIEEVHDVGLSELRACQSNLVQALLHLLKLSANASDPAAAHWSGEIAAFLANARRAFTPSMRRRIALDDIYADARHQFGLMRRDLPMPPATCPWELDDLLTQRPDPGALLRKLTGAGD